jgi:predicted DNA-binding transcriptional regulator AlpA
MSSPFPPSTHHLDKYTHDFLPRFLEGDPDQLLSTKEVALLLHVSVQWLEIGRCSGYGPPFVRLTPSMVRYKRGAIAKWLRSRAKQGSTVARRPKKRAAR